MVFGYYDVESTGEEPIVYDLNAYRLITIPYQYYSDFGRLVLYLGAFESTCILDWEEFLNTKDMTRVTHVDDKTYQMLMDLVQMKYVHYYKDLIGFTMAGAVNDIANLLENCEYFELKYGDIDGYVLDSFMPLIVGNTIKCIGISSVRHTGNKHTDNVLYVVSVGGEVVQEFDVELLPVKISDFSVNAEI